AHRSTLVEQRSSRNHSKPIAAYRQRVSRAGTGRASFNAPENWYEPTGDSPLRFVVQPPGTGYIHPVTAEEVRARLDELPEEFTRDLEVVQFSRMTRKRRTFPCYGMQWGQTVYLYPIEET